MEVCFSKKDNGLVRRFWKSEKRMGPGDSKWAYIFSGYCRSIPQTERRLFRDFVRDIPRNICERCLIEGLKDVTSLCMPYVLDGFLWLRYFLDLKVLGGYDTTLNREDPFAEYRSTFGKRPHKEVPEDLKFWIEDTVSKIGIDSVGFSFRDFVSFRDAWALPGVSVLTEIARLKLRT
jgi:hypothetical protein